VRQFALIAVGGIVLGLVLALVLSVVRGPGGPRELGPCTAELLRLAPTLALDSTGTRAEVGVSAPGPARCAIPSLRPLLTVEVDSAGGKRIVRRSRHLPAFTERAVDGSFTGSIPVAALPLCRAAQPLHYVVRIMGLSASGDGSLLYLNGRCYLG
jgi:hypothetical protein